MYIKGELTTEHAQALMKNALAASGKLKKTIDNLTAAVAVIFPAVTFLVKPSFHPIQLGIYIISAILLALLLPAIIQKMFFRKIKNESDTDEMVSFTLHVTGKGIHVKKDTGNMLVEWEDIERVSADERNFFLYFSNGPIVIIPKDANVSEMQIKDMLSSYVGESKIESVPKTETKRLGKRAMISSLVSVLVLLFVIQFMFIGAQDENESEIDIAIEEVNDLFVDANVTVDWEIDEQTTYQIKDSTDQRKIEQAIKAVNQIDPDDITDENYMLIFGLKMSVLEAQEQFDKREGK